MPSSHAPDLERFFGDGKFLGENLQFCLLVRSFDNGSSLVAGLTSGIVHNKRPHNADRSRSHEMTGMSLPRSQYASRVC